MRAEGVSKIPNKKKAMLELYNATLDAKQKQRSHPFLTTLSSFPTTPPLPPLIPKNVTFQAGQARR